MLALIEDRMPHLTSTEATVRQTAAAYLARCRRLLIAMDALREEQLIDVTSLPLRPLFEAWLVAMWVLYEREPAVNRLVEDYQASLEKMNRLANLGWDPALYASGDQLPSVETLCQKVGNHLQADGQANARSHLDFTYNLIYRGESLRSIHAGLGTAEGHVRESGGRMEIVPVRYEAGDGKGEVLWAATLVAMLAHRVFDLFGLSVRRLDELGLAIVPADSRDAFNAADPLAQRETQASSTLESPHIRIPRPEE
jgi:hypothetical protein